MKQSLRVGAILGAALMLGGAARPQEPQRLSGYYTVRWEEQSFQPCGEHQRWWVADPGPMLRRYRELMDGQYGTVYVSVRAEVSEPGHYGHLGMYSRSAAVREVISARAAGENDCRASDVAVE
jgi:hypothetical protein